MHLWQSSYQSESQNSIYEYFLKLKIRVGGFIRSNLPAIPPNPLSIRVSFFLNSFSKIGDRKRDARATILSLKKFRRLSRSRISVLIVELLC